VIANGRLCDTSFKPMLAGIGQHAALPTQHGTITIYHHTLPQSPAYHSPVTQTVSARSSHLQQHTLSAFPATKPTQSTLSTHNTRTVHYSAHMIQVLQATRKKTLSNHPAKGRLSEQSRTRNLLSVCSGGSGGSGCDVRVSDWDVVVGRVFGRFGMGVR